MSIKNIKINLNHNQIDLIDKGVKFLNYECEGSVKMGKELTFTEMREDINNELQKLITNENVEEIENIIYKFNYFDDRQREQIEVLYDSLELCQYQNMKKDERIKGLEKQVENYCDILSGGKEVDERVIEELIRSGNFTKDEIRDNEKVIKNTYIYKKLELEYKMLDCLDNMKKMINEHINETKTIREGITDEHDDRKLLTAYDLVMERDRHIKGLMDLPNDTTLIEEYKLESVRKYKSSQIDKIEEKLKSIYVE